MNVGDLVYIVYTWGQVPVIKTGIIQRVGAKTAFVGSVESGSIYADGFMRRKYDIDELDTTPAAAWQRYKAQLERQLQNALSNVEECKHKLSLIPSEH